MKNTNDAVLSVSAADLNRCAESIFFTALCRKTKKRDFLASFLMNKHVHCKFLYEMKDNVSQNERKCQSPRKNPSAAEHTQAVHTATLPLPLPRRQPTAVYVVQPHTRHVTTADATMADATMADPAGQPKVCVRVRPCGVSWCGARSRDV